MEGGPYAPPGVIRVKGIDGKAPPGVELAAQFDSTREISPDPNVYDD